MIDSLRLRLRIGAKVFLSPVFLFVCLATIGALGWHGIGRQTDALESLYSVAGRKSEASSGIVLAMVTAHSDLYRAIAWAQTAEDKEQIEQIKTEATARLSDVNKRISALLAMPLNEEEAELARSVAAAVGRYGDAYKSVMEMVGVDLFSAQIFMQTADSSYSESKGLLASLQQYARNVNDRAHNNAVAEADTARARLLLGLLIAIAAAALITYAAARSIVRPLHRLTGDVTRVAEGDLEAAVGQTERQDEIGVLAHAIEGFRNGIVDARRLRGEQEESKRNNERQRRADMLALADRFESGVSAVLNSLEAAASLVENAATTVAGAAEDGTGRSAAAAAAATAASTSVRAAAKTGREIATLTLEIAEQSRQSSALTSAAVSQAGKVRTAMDLLEEKVQAIGDVVNLIRGIASQTNLLALNATIESARAGEHGKGFAIVAQEVKALASETVRATHVISTRLEETDAATTDTVSSIGEIIQFLTDIQHASGTIAQSVARQEACALDIAERSEDASRNAGLAADEVGGTAVAVRTTGESAAAMQKAVGDLSEQMTNLRREVDAFLAGVRQG